MSDTDADWIEFYLKDAFNEIVATQVPDDSPKPKAVVDVDNRYGQNVILLKVAYPSNSICGTGRLDGQKVIEILSEVFHEEGFCIAFDKDGMEIVLEQNEVTKFCELPLMLFPMLNPVLAGQILRQRQNTLN